MAMNSSSKEPGRLEKANYIIRLIWAVVTVIILLVVLIAIMKRGAGY